MLKSLKLALKAGGELILDSIIIDGDESMCLCPQNSYAKMSNVFFIPTKAALGVWLTKAGFEYEFLGELKTLSQEQRKTEWIHGQSLQDFLNPNDNNLTIEGYPAPKRAYFKCKRANG
jgi:tRNA (mo5U34)-methyltransferase